MWDCLVGEEGRGEATKGAGASRDALRRESRLAWECAMEEANDSCLRGDGDPMKDGVTAQWGELPETETGVEEVGVEGALLAAAAAAAADIDAAGMSERLCVSKL